MLPVQFASHLAEIALCSVKLLAHLAIQARRGCQYLQGLVFR